LDYALNVTVTLGHPLGRHVSKVIGSNEMDTILIYRVPTKTSRFGKRQGLVGRKEPFVCCIDGSLHRKEASHHVTILGTIQLVDSPESLPIVVDEQR
jgi:hypothetical protein